MDSDQEFESTGGQDRPSSMYKLFTPNGKSVLLSCKVKKFNHVISIITNHHYLNDVLKNMIEKDDILWDKIIEIHNKNNLFFKDIINALLSAEGLTALSEELLTVDDAIKLANNQTLTNFLKLHDLGALYMTILLH